MVKSFIILVLSFFTISCADGVEHWELKSMERQCEQNGGISNINTFMQVGASCTNGLFVVPRREAQTQ